MTCARTQSFRAALLFASSVTGLARVEVLFQNTGPKAGWSSLGVQHMGRIDEVGQAAPPAASLVIVVSNREAGV